MLNPHKRRVRNYFLNSAYQLRYTLVMVLISSLLTAGLGFFWYKQMRVSSNVIEAMAISSEINKVALSQIREDLESHDRNRLLMLLGFGLLLAVTVACFSIVLTHKVAGPLHLISLYMDEIREGRLGLTRDLRKGDQLSDFYQTFRGMHAALRAVAESELQDLDSIIALTEKSLARLDEKEAREIGQQLELLKELRARKAAMLNTSS